MNFDLAIYCTNPLFISSTFDVLELKHNIKGECVGYMSKIENEFVSITHYENVSINEYKKLLMTLKALKRNSHKHSIDNILFDYEIL